MKLTIPENAFNAIAACRGKTKEYKGILLELGETHYRVVSTMGTALFMAELPYTAEDELDDTDVSKICIVPKKLSEERIIEITDEKTVFQGEEYKDDPKNKLYLYHKIVENLKQTTDTFPAIDTQIWDKVREVCVAYGIELKDTECYSFGLNSPMIVKISDSACIIISPMFMPMSAEPFELSWIMKDISEW